MQCAYDANIKGEKMESSREKKESNDIEMIKHYLVGLGFICNSYPSAQHFIYSKKWGDSHNKKYYEIK